MSMKMNVLQSTLARAFRIILTGAPEPIGDDLYGSGLDVRAGGELIPGFLKQSIGSCLHLI
jgi:hypothetical protein